MIVQTSLGRYASLAGIDCERTGESVESPTVKSIS